MITINNKKGIPKYKQIINSIEEMIVSGILLKGDQIPSINQIKNDHNLSRDTVLMAFNDLKKRGIIESIVGKGYYITSENVNIAQKVFLLFDELNSFKEDLYNSFLENLGNNIQVDIFFHHFNIEVFTKLIQDNIGDYNYYVIMPANFSKTNDIIQRLPPEKVYILDQLHHDLTQYSGIYQNFEKSIYEHLETQYIELKKYKKLILVNSDDKQPQGMIDGFIKFCRLKSINNLIVSSLKDTTPQTGDLYIIPDDKNLLRILKKIKSMDLTLSKDVGIISYNDTLLKEIVEGGITTISTDFNAMGGDLAKMILNKKTFQIENPSKLIIRNSL